MRKGGLSAFLLHIVTVSPLAALAHNNVLQILFFAIVFGATLSLCGSAGKPVMSVIDGIAQILFSRMGFIVSLAPLGVLGAIGFTIGRYDLSAFERLIAFVAIYFVAVTLLTAFCLGSVLRACGLRLLPLISYLREELLTVLATTSSDAVLPQIMEKLRQLGIKAEVVGLVIPAGYSFNLDAMSIYLSMSVFFLAQASGITLSLTQIVLILWTALITSKGAHGVPGMAIVILAATLAVIPSIPPIGLVLILSVDWYIGIARETGNVIGNCVATIMIAYLEKDIDLAQAKKILRLTKEDLPTSAIAGRIPTMEVV